MMSIYGAVIFLLIYFAVALILAGLLRLLDLVVHGGRRAPLPIFTQPDQFDSLDEDGQQSRHQADKED